MKSFKDCFRALISEQLEPALGILYQFIQNPIFFTLNFTPHMFWTIKLLHQAKTFLYANLPLTSSSSSWALDPATNPCPSCSISLNFLLQSHIEIIPFRQSLRTLLSRLLHRHRSLIQSPPSPISYPKTSYYLSKFTVLMAPPFPWLNGQSMILISIVLPSKQK